MFVIIPRTFWNVTVLLQGHHEKNHRMCGEIESFIQLDIAKDKLFA